MNRPRAVLHIDDDPDTRLLVRELSREQASGGQGQQIRWLEASGVGEALHRHAHEQIDLVLLDHRLRTENGLELIPRVKAVWNCPVWLVTGFAPESLSAEAGLREAAGVIGKDRLLRSPSQLRRFLEAAWASMGSQIVSSTGDRW